MRYKSTSLGTNIFKRTLSEGETSITACYYLGVVGYDKQSFIAFVLQQGLPEGRRRYNVKGLSLIHI